MSNFVTLLVEDDASQREAFADLLKDEGFEVIECATAEAAELIIANSKSNGSPGGIACRQTGTATEHSSANSPAGKMVAAGRHRLLHTTTRCRQTRSDICTAFRYSTSPISGGARYGSRSQNDWTDLGADQARLADDWLPQPRILHPWPQQSLRR